MYITLYILLQICTNLREDMSTPQRPLGKMCTCGVDVALLLQLKTM